MGKTLKIEVTDQRDRNCGWVCHVSVEAAYGDEVIHQSGGFSNAKTAQYVAEVWVKDFCRDTLAALGGGWECAARKQGTAGGNEPADCNWPVCGCDPYADKVIDALREGGMIAVIRDAPPTLPEAGGAR